MGNSREIRDMRRVVGGMQTDTAPLNQVPNSYRLALNMSMESREGDYSSLVNEEGNEKCFSLEDNEKIIGTILINNGDTVIFIANDTDNISKVSILDKDCNLTNLIKSSCLSFTERHPIHGTFRINNGCDRIIYFTDNFNPVRSINLDDLGLYTPQVGTSVADWVNNANTNDTWLCDLIRFNSTLDIPSIDFSSIDETGGRLKVGSYFFSIRYLTSNLDPTNWFYISQPVNVGTSPKTDQGFHLLNSSGGEVDEPTEANTGRIINLDISDLDQSYEFYQLAVVQYTEGFGTNPTNVYELPMKTINSDTDIYSYSGAEELIPITLDEVAIPTITFNRVGSIAQLDNRLIFANISDQPVDWADLQRSSSDIYVSWDTVALNKMHVGSNQGDLIQADASTGKYSFDYQTWMRDEIYALGIVYVFNDGSESPVCHIPGRPPNFGARLAGTVDNATLRTWGNFNYHSRNNVPVTENWDTQLLTVVSSSTTPNDSQVRESNVKHIPLTEFTGNPAVRLGSTIERWKVYNTAAAFATSQQTNPQRRLNTFGVMSFYQGKEVYPDIRDCNNQSIWGNDIAGNSLVGQPIRHHKMPDSTFFPIDDGTPINTFNSSAQLYPIRLSFSNITIPSNLQNRIKGFYIVKAVRTDSTSTVLDTGFLGGTRYIAPINGEPAKHSINLGLTDPDSTQANNFEQTDQVCTFISPRSQFRKDIKPNSYFKLDEKVVSSQSTLTNILNARDIVEEEAQFRAVSDYAYVDKETDQPAIGNFPYLLRNPLINIDILFTYLEDPKPQLSNDNSGSGSIDTEYYYTSLKQWINPYEDIFSLSYERTSNKIIEIGTATDIHFITNGDTYLGEMSFRTLSLPAKSIDSTSGVWNAGRLFTNFYFESKINMELRKTGPESYETHWRDFTGTVNEFLDLLQIEGPNAGIGYSLEYFVENRDMSVRNNFRLYFPLPRSYDYCTGCNNTFPTRIWYSDRAYQETRQDNYRRFLANDYRDLVANGGEITNLFVFKDQLYAQTPETTWFVSTRPQQLQTNEGTISVGTGDLLAIPPKRLETVDRGYAGNQHKFSTSVCEYGTVWVDANAGKVFNFNGQLNELSAIGNRNWFSENLPFTGGVNEQIAGFNTNSTVHRNGIGISATYDPRHNRYILHKKYYRIRNDNNFLTALTVTTGYTTSTPSGFNTTTGEFYTWNTGDPEPTIMDFQNTPEIIEDLSWTLVYSFAHKSWVSFVSYMPNWLWHDRNTMFSYSNDTFNENVRYGWKHGTFNYCNYYNRTHPSTLYLIFNQYPTETKLFNNVSIISQAYDRDSTGNLIELTDDCFDEVFLHTAKQSSGITTVNVKSDTDTTNPFITLTSGPSEILVQNNEDTWDYSEFYDSTTNYTLPVFTSDWLNTTYQSKRSVDGYVYYPNTTRDSFTKNLFQVAPLRGKWLGCFMNYSNQEGNKFVVDFISTLENISFK